MSVSRIHYLLWAREPAEPGERRRDGQFADSPLEEAGFEPPVSLKAPGVLVVSVVVRAEFSVGEEPSGCDMSGPRKLRRLTRYRRFESGFLRQGVRANFMSSP